MYTLISSWILTKLGLGCATEESSALQCRPESSTADLSVFASSSAELFQARLSPIIAEIQKLSQSEKDGYDEQLITFRLMQFREARLTKDINQILFLLRSTLSRDLGGMSSASINRIAAVKRLNEAYQDEVIGCLDLLCQMYSTNDRVNVDEVLSIIERTARSFGNTAITLSGGACTSLSHVGVMKELLHEKLNPQVICGSSAGSIVAAIFCMHSDAELEDVLKNYYNWELYPFSPKDEPDTVLVRIARFLKHGNFLDAKNLVESMQEIYSDVTFAEAYQHTKRILNITVSTNGAYDMPNLLNYITAPNVLIWSAVAASCSLPLLFETSQVFAKDPLTGRQYPLNPTFPFCMDGSVEGDVPKARLAELFNVNYFIISQVNPHVAPVFRFIENSENQFHYGTGSYIQNIFRKITNEMYYLFFAELNHTFQFFHELGFTNIFVEKVRQFLNQSYSGDIVILPKIDMYSIRHMIKNPTREYLLESTKRGSEAMFPKMEMIRNNTAIEIALRKTIEKLKALASSKTDLPLLTWQKKATRSQENLRNGVRHRFILSPSPKIEKSIISRSSEHRQSEQGMSVRLVRRLSSVQL